MPHSIVSSTGSDHGSFTHSSFADVTMSSRLNLDYSQKLPELRSTAKKYGRWTPRPTPHPDYVINTSAIGRAFPNYSSGSSDNSSSLSLDLGRAPLNNKTHTNTNTNTNTNRPKSPILEALRPTSPQKENIPPTVEHSHQPLATPQKQRTRAEMQPRVDDDSNHSIMSYKNSRFQVASPNVSTKRQTLVPPQPTHHSAPIQPTHHSFAVPAITTSESATLDNVVPVTTQGGRVHARRNSKALIQAASFGPVHSIPMPDEEEGIYLLIELLKNRVARVEAENTELKDFKESHSQLKADHEQLVTDHKELEESHNQLITLNNQLEESHGQLDTRYKELKEAHGQIQEDYEQFFAQFKELREFHSQLQEDHEQMVSHYNGLKEDHKQLASHYKELKKSHAHLDTQNKLLDSEKAQLVLEQAQWVSERRSIQEPTVSDIVQQHFTNSQNAKMPTHPVAKPTRPVFSVEKPTKPVHPVEKPTKPVHSVEKPTKPVYPVEKPTTKPATLSASARHVLDSLCPEHNAKNCMLCTRVTSFGDKTTGGAPIRSANPIPVSKRMPVATPYEDEPTIRPSVEPSLALSTVIKGLEDEIAHLKMRQSEVQKQYNSLDASLGKRERRRIGKELESLFQQLEFKGDQLYGLYDALEGLQ